MSLARLESPRVCWRPAVAFDRSAGSVRRFDTDGRLHVERANISKATVNPYRGNEIPGWEELGLDPNETFQLLRDPDELEKAASTFNGLPLLSEHVPVDAENHQPRLIVGSTGTDAKFESPYLTNSLVVWSQHAIDLIESGEQRGLSCAYRYVCDMQPGTYQGVPFQGRMKNLRGNHLALVRDGRVPEAIVGDAALLEEAGLADLFALVPEIARIRRG